MRRLSLIPFVIASGCSRCTPNDTGIIDTSDTYISDTDTDTDNDTDSDTDSDSDSDADTDTDVNHAPEITNTSISSAVVNTAYSSAVTARDVDKDSLTYSLTASPSWLNINSATGALSGTPTATGNYNVTASVTDGLLNDTQDYVLTVGSMAALDLYVIDGDNGMSADSACSIDVTLTNTSSGYSETATMNSSGVAVFSLNETGTYDISVPSTNAGSNCYGGFAHSEWLDVSAGSNSSWVVLIPESYQNDVIDVVGSQIDMGDMYGHASGAVDSVTKLVKYMSGVSSRVHYMGAWNDSIRNGTTPLTVDTIDWTYGGIQYNDGLELAIGYWEGSLAPSITQVSSGGDINFTRGSNWQVTDINYDATGYVITDAEIEYSAVGGDVYDIATIFAHEMGHPLLLSHTDVDVFIMNSSPSFGNEPHEEEKRVYRIINNLGPETPNGNRVDVYESLLE